MLGLQRDLSLAYNPLATYSWLRATWRAHLNPIRQTFAIAERLAQADAGNAGWQRDLSIAYEEVGEVQLKQGDLAGALKSYQAISRLRSG